MWVRQLIAMTMPCPFDWSCRWGSSIAQGGVVQNAGMTWPMNLQRLLDVPLLNFGFSGQCRMQADVAEFLSELTPSLFIMDCLPNMDAAAVNTSAVQILKQLRAAFGDDVPIAVLEGHRYTNAWLFPSVAEAQDAKRNAQRAAVAQVWQSANCGVCMQKPAQPCLILACVPRRCNRPRPKE